MLRTLVALLLLALLAPCAAADGAAQEPSAGEPQAEDAPPETSEQGDKQKGASDGAKDKQKCKDKDPCPSPEPEPEPEDEQHELAVSLTLDTANPTASSVEGGRQDSDGNGGEAMRTSQSTTATKANYFEVVILSNGGIPSCEPWLILGTHPTLRPECLLPAQD